MKASEWFVSYDYGGCAFLLPHSCVKNGNVSETCDVGKAARINMDAMAKSIFPGLEPGEAVSRVLLEDGYDFLLESSVLPKAVGMELGKFSPVRGVMKPLVGSRGILALMLSPEKITYLVSPGKFFESWKRADV